MVQEVDKLEKEISIHKLNREQEDAANFVNGTCAVIAVPGSGKTKTMTERIGILVKQHGIAPENILGLTFTRNAANAMRIRLAPVLNELADRVTLQTIHSFCHSLLRNEGQTFELLIGKGQFIFIKNIMKDLRIKDLTVGMVLREISLAKGNLISSEEFRTLYEGDKTMIKIADIYTQYEQEKDRRLQMDFDDLLTESYMLLTDKQDIRDRYRETYKHILVDEFQDTNPAQLELLKVLIDEKSLGNGSSFWVCGDDWQSIYAFMGASVSNLLKFKEMFPDSKQFVLNLNYRSTPQILKGCQNLITHNIKKIDKTLTTNNDNGDDIIFLECSTEQDEALNIVTEIKDLVESRGYAYKDIAILYRANFQSRVIEESFSEHKIPYHIENGMNFYQRHEIKVLLDYMRLINSPETDEGDEALLHVINIPNRYLGRTFANELQDHAAKKGIHLYQALKETRSKVYYIKKSVKEFIEFMDPLIADSKNIEPSELIYILRTSLDYDKYVTEDDMPSPDDVKIANLNQLQIAANKLSDIDSFIKYTETFDSQASNDDEGVSLMTIHKSKGLEFPVVYLIGMIDLIMPTKRGDIEEERRICFVGISRAMKLLYLCHSQTYLGQKVRKSIFLEEIQGLKIRPIKGGQ